MDEAIKELGAFHQRTADPAPLPHQYVGTIIDNTIGLLGAPLNSIDGGSRYIKFDDPHNWRSLMQAVHRSFFSSILSAVEKGLYHLCEEHQFEVTGSQSEKLLASVHEIQELLQGAGIQTKELEKIAKHFQAYKPGFNDYLNALLEESSLNKDAKKKWRGFFRALSIVRNKVSHSDVSLTDQERSDLHSGGCGVMVAGDGSLAINTRMYAQVASIVLVFFDELYPSLSDAIGK
jgi:hypothetical protein